MKTLAVIPGDSVFESHKELIEGDTTFFLAETSDLAKHYKYHSHKIVLFFAAMRHHAEELRSNGNNVFYHEYNGQSYKEILEDHVESQEYNAIRTYVPKDHFFTTPRKVARENGLSYTELPNKNFFLSREDFKEYIDDNKYYMASFYAEQRKKFDVFVEDGSPHKGKWSFDADNREKLKDTSKIPSLPEATRTSIVEDVIRLVENEFPDNPGRPEDFWLPVTREGAEQWADRFFEERFRDFGAYQDAINKGEAFAYHSVISPMLNIGLLNPRGLVETATKYYEEKDVPYNSVEGFIRQILGWREFMKGVYDTVDEKKNFFGNQGKLTKHWYEGTTGLEPVDDVIKQVRRYGYAHHIQRLMILSNAMLLSELHPDEVYNWFMELFVDSADWVMAPNVYGMGQYADGGVFATKPYISSSNYVLKMSDYSKGDWCDTWDALYWAFIDKHREVFKENNRMKFMVSLLDKKGEEEIDAIRNDANTFKARVTK